MATKKKAPDTPQSATDVPNVFISWGGNRSLHIAKALHETLDLMIDDARPWRSDDSIRTGEAWFPAIVAALQEAKIGIMCLTPESLAKPWLNFEAGAIGAKVRDRSLVMTVRAAGLKTRDVEPPLSMYQGGAIEDRAFMFKLFCDVGVAIGATVSDATLEKRFKDSAWPRLLKAVSEMPDPEDPVPPERNLEAVTGEILDLVRGMRADLPPRPTGAKYYTADLDSPPPTEMVKLARWLGDAEVMVLRPTPVDFDTAESKARYDFAKKITEEYAAKVNSGPSSLAKLSPKKKPDK